MGFIMRILYFVNVYIMYMMLLTLVYSVCKYQLNFIFHVKGLSIYYVSIFIDLHRVEQNTFYAVQVYKNAYVIYGQPPIEKAYLFSSSILLWYALQSNFVLCSNIFIFSFQYCSQFYETCFKNPDKANSTNISPSISAGAQDRAGNVSH